MTIPAILSAEISERIAVANLRATAAVLLEEITRFLANSSPASLQRLNDVLTAAQDQICNVERARDDLADLEDEYAHATLMMARRAA
jgi:hypothetical protein